MSQNCEISAHLMLFSFLGRNCGQMYLNCHDFLVIIMKWFPSVFCQQNLNLHNYIKHRYYREERWIHVFQCICIKSKGEDRAEFEHWPVFPFSLTITFVLQAHIFNERNTYYWCEMPVW